jgi:hypothetical protein
MYTTSYIPAWTNHRGILLCIVSPSTQVPLRSLPSYYTRRGGGWSLFSSREDIHREISHPSWYLSRSCWRWRRDRYMNSSPRRRRAALGLALLAAGCWPRENESRLIGDSATRTGSDWVLKQSVWQIVVEKMSRMAYCQSSTGRWSSHDWLTCICASAVRTIRVPTRMKWFQSWSLSKAYNDITESHINFQIAIT